MGLLGLGAFLALMGAVLLYVYRAYKQHDAMPEMRPILIGLTAGLIGALANGVVDHYFFNLGFHPAITILWTFIGLALAASRIVIQANQNRGKDSPPYPVH